MADAHEATGASQIAVQDVAPDKTDSYGIVATEAFNDRSGKITAMVEKPKPADAPSNLGVVGRYVLDGSIFKLLEATKPGAGGEIQLTDAIATLLQQKPVHAYRFRGHALRLRRAHRPGRGDHQLRPAQREDRRSGGQGDARSAQGTGCARGLSPSRRGLAADHEKGGHGPPSSFPDPDACREARADDSPAQRSLPTDAVGAATGGDKALPESLRSPPLAAPTAARRFSAAVSQMRRPCSTAATGA